MPRISRTVLPRIRKSIEERGVLVTLARSVLLPAHLLKEYRASRELRREQPVSDFDLVHGVDTEGDLSQRSSNRIHELDPWQQLRRHRTGTIPCVDGRIAHSLRRINVH